MKTITITPQMYEAVAKELADKVRNKEWLNTCVTGSFDEYDWVLSAGVAIYYNRSFSGDGCPVNEIQDITFSHGAEAFRLYDPEINYPNNEVGHDFSFDEFKNYLFREL